MFDCATPTREPLARLVEQYAKILEKRGLSLTPGSLYLAYFAGPAAQWPCFQPLNMPTPPRLWPLQTRPVEPPAKNLSGLIHSLRY